ncbi:hypothetical protein KNN17_00215 [Arthrobacter bambusae]|uniref:hypothetical protein n=1 Tax=Arthrobacter TaxID=1663 RepID=UPI001F50944C|nr:MULTISPECIES: hypothetical protein [Arthrobacter]MCI0139996.1 hypothetical protein [Arthrobacter bambusae]
MKWYSYAHPPIFMVSLAILFMTNWDLWLRILLPSVVLVLYVVNEAVLHRRKKAARALAAELERTDPMVHAYREPPS